MLYMTRDDQTQSQKEVTQTKPETEMKENYQPKVEKEATSTKPCKGGARRSFQTHRSQSKTHIHAYVNHNRGKSTWRWWAKGFTLMREIHQLEWKHHVQRVSSSPEAGLFSVTFKDTNSKAKEEMSNQWEWKAREGSPSYRLIMEEVQMDQILKLDQLLEEVNTKTMEAYLSEYLIVLDLSEHGLGE